MSVSAPALMLAVALLGSTVRATRASGAYPICFPPDNALKCSKLGASSKCKGTYCCRPKPAADQHCAACGQDGRCSECDAG